MLYALSPRRAPFPLSLPFFSLSSRNGPAPDKPPVQHRTVAYEDGDGAGGRRWELNVLGTQRRGLFIIEGVPLGEHLRPRWNLG